jgi:diguanylate cyclase (GGDEF)-like protein
VCCAVGVFALLLWLVFRRPPSSRLQTALEEIGTRLEQIDSKVQRPPAAPGLGPAIVETLDLGEVLQRTLAATPALGVGVVDGARVSIRKPDGSVVTAVEGILREDSEPVLGGPPDGSPYVFGRVSWETPSGGIRSGLAVPLGGGSLAVFSRTPDAFDSTSAALLAEIARNAEPAVRNALEHLEVIEAAATDGRTGFGSASAFEQSLPQAIDLARRHDRELCLVQIDMDNFGSINKQYSNARGNSVLEEFGRRVLATIRGGDAVFRQSGGADEFFLVLPETGLDAAKMSYRRLALEVAAIPFDEVGSVTMSSGLVQLRPDETQATFLARADELVKLAKERGKNRLCSEDGDEWVPPLG